MTKLLKNFAKDESGATAIEYGLIATLIAVAIIVGATALGSSLSTKFDNISNCLDNPTTDGCAAAKGTS
jgi:pilus assembly protein Flp/PilA